MKIEMTQSVKHGGRDYSKEDRITVDEGLGAYFMHCGWAKRLDGETSPADPPPKDVTLDVQSSRHVHSANLRGE